MGILTLILLAAFFFTPLAYAAEYSDSAEIIESEDVKGKVELDTNEPIQLNNEEKAFAENAKSNSPEPSFKRTWDFVKGKPIDDSILLGMFSYHTSSDRDEYNETNDLLGIDLKGYSVGYFKNSYYDDTYYVGISRKIYEYRINKEIKLDVKYKFVGMHGYQDDYPDFLGITPIIMPMLGVSWRMLGVDFTIIPDDRPIFTISFRFNLPERKTKK